MGIRSSERARGGFPDAPLCALSRRTGWREAIAVRLHAGSNLLTDQVLDVVLVEDKTSPHPVLRTANGLHMTLEAALTNYDVIGASPEERRILARWGHPFGGVQ